MYGYPAIIHRTLLHNLIISAAVGCPLHNCVFDRSGHSELEGAVLLLTPHRVRTAIHANDSAAEEQLRYDELQTTTQSET